MAASKVALITAGSRGVGAAVARALARDAHMRVVVNYHSDSTSANAIVKELNELSPLSASFQANFVALKADMNNREEIVRLVNDTLRTMGRLDVVVSNVGWTRMTDFMNLQDADVETDWDQCFQTNVKSHFFLFQACRKHLEDTEGAFIATASVAGVKPSGSSLVRANKTR
jgi:NAD(P)-dependent dehydrogenase (short-subunit alcohol dehydrogenase family)